MRKVFTYLFTLSLTAASAQMIKFQAAGFGGTTLNVAGTTTKHSMIIGAPVSQAAGQSNRAGFFWGSPDYRPAAQSAGVAFSSLSHNSLTITWTNGNGTRRVVVGKASGPVNATINSATNYPANSVFGSGGTEIGASSGNFAVYNGTGTSVTVSNLNPSVIYHFKVFEYNGFYSAYPSNYVNIEYQTGNGTGNPGNRTTLASPASTAANGISFSNITKNQSTVTWNNGNGTNRYLIVKQGSPVSASPANGQPYISSAAFGSGADLGSSNFVSYDGSSNQITITNLLPNTVYHYQVVEYKGTGADNNFYLTGAPVASQLTLTAEPVATAGSAMTQTAFSANWQTVAGAVNHYIDVSEDAGFSSFVPTYQNKLISGGGTITAGISGLAPGTTYHFRVRAENATGQSANSNAIAVLTVPATPVIQVSTDVQTTSFTANWSNSLSATDYYLDVATDAAFTQLVSGFTNAQTSNASLSVTGLTPGTRYYLRVSSKNSSGQSSESASFPQFTIPTEPLELAVSNEQKTSFKIKWKGVTGADDYEVNVLNDATGVTASGYPKMTTLLEEIVTGLSLATKYKVFIKAHNAGGNSASSETVLGYTLNDDGTSVNPPAVTINASQSTIGTAAAQVSGGESPLLITFKHKTITSTTNFSAETAVSLATSPSAHNKTINPAWADELGVEYYFVLKDAAGRSDSTDVQYAYKSFSSQEVGGFTGFTGKPASYVMFSIPADLGSNNDVTAVLQAVFAKFQNYDKTKWRLFHWPGGESEGQNYLEFDAFNKIDKGNGYWFNAVENISGVTVSGSVMQVNQKSPFKVALRKGWNQIGNPYPFPVSWTAVKADPANTALNLKSLWQFEGGQYTKASDAFKAWRGAFVYSQADGELVFPVTSRTTGRVGEMELPAMTENGIWRLPIELTHQNLKHLGAVGMHPAASLSLDKYDEPELPRFIEYLEMKTRLPEPKGQNMAENIVTTADHYTWLFTVSSNLGEGEAELTWDPKPWMGREDVLMLLDISEETLVDMKSNARYAFNFSDGKQFKVIYSKDPRFKPGVTMLGQAYPNPFMDHVKIPVLIEKENSKIKLEVYDLMGRQIRSMEYQFSAPGLYHLEWDGTENNGEKAAAGTLLYRLSNAENSKSTVRRLIKTK